MHLDEMLENNVDKIILGCTHYPYLLNVLSKFVPEEKFINPAKFFAEYICHDLKENNLVTDKNSGEQKFYVTSKPEQFKSASKLFYNVQKVEEVVINKITLA